MHMELKREVKLKLDFATETETRFFNKIAPFESLKTVFQDTCWQVFPHDAYFTGKPRQVQTYCIVLQ